MATLNAAQTATVNITTPGGYITVDCSSGAVVQVSWVSPGGVTGQRRVLNISEDLGPFADSTVITLRCDSGSADYSEVGSQVPALVSKDGIGRVNVALVGDSLLASYLSTTGGTTIGALNEHSYMQWAQRFSLGVLNIKRVYAVSGTRIADHIVQAASVDVTDTPVVFEDGGINDFNIDSATVSYCVGKKLALWAALKAKGVQIVSLSLLPLDAAGGGSLTKSQRIHAFNRECQRQAPAYGVRWINLYEIGVDPTSANGYAKSGYLYDGLHNSAPYGYRAGKAIWNAISADPMFRQSYPLASTPLDGYVAGSEVPAWLANPLFSGTAGTANTGVTGSVPDSWEVYRGAGVPTATTTIIADPDGFGSALQIAMTATANGDQIITRSASAVNGLALNDLFNGEVVCRVTANGGNLRCIVPFIILGVDGVNQFVYGGNLSASQLTADMLAENVPFLLSTPVVAANKIDNSGAAITSVRLFIAAQFAGAGSATIVLSRARGRKLVTY